MEGRGIVSKDFNGLSDPYVMVSYNKRDASTRTVFKSLNPIFGDVMLFQENRCASGLHAIAPALLCGVALNEQAGTLLSVLWLTPQEEGGRVPALSLIHI